jgi:diguanylate cyclase (GGDEF)-like protein
MPPAIHESGIGEKPADFTRRKEAGVEVRAGERRGTSVGIGRLSLAGQILLLGAAYFGAAKLSLLLAIPPGYATAVWPPSGIALTALLLFGQRMWPGIWIGATLVNVTVASSLGTALVIGTGNALEALAGAWLLRRLVGIPRRFERGRDVVLFVATAAACCTIAATVGATALAVAGAVPLSHLPSHWWTWWQGDLTGIIIVAPLLLNWSLRRAAPWPQEKRLEAACFAVLLVAVTLFAFNHGDALGTPASAFSLTFAIMPFMIWAALRFSPRVVTTAIAATCAFAIYYTVDDLRTFPQDSLNESLLTLLAFISTMVVTGLVLSAVMEERKLAMDRLARALDALREQAMTDPLTGLYNRRYLVEFLQREWIRARRRESSLGVIMVDLDHFKRINDSFGHPAGDYVLSAVSALLRIHIRSSDIVCRYGGEEFALVVPEASLVSMQRRAEEIRAAIARLELRYGERPLGRITASLGVALFPDHADGPDSVLQAADEALYAAKDAGRDCTIVSTARNDRSMASA